jgi:hypothetical protein
MFFNSCWFFLEYNKLIWGMATAAAGFGIFAASGAIGISAFSWGYGNVVNK